MKLLDRVWRVDPDEREPVTVSVTRDAVCRYCRADIVEIVYLGTSERIPAEADLLDELGDVIPWDTPWRPGLAIRHRVHDCTGTQPMVESLRRVVSALCRAARALTAPSQAIPDRTVSASQRTFLGDESRGRGAYG
jgi:hypothetical protein